MRLNDHYGELGVVKTAPLHSVANGRHDAPVPRKVVEERIVDAQTSGSAAIVGANYQDPGPRTR